MDSNYKQFGPKHLGTAVLKGDFAVEGIQKIRWVSSVREAETHSWEGGDGRWRQVSRKSPEDLSNPTTTARPY